MATDNNIKNFTGADIEKYHKGQLSAKERHDLEKAALDDPFLADALEGYAVAGANHSIDMDELKNRLAEKVETTKVVSMKTGGKNSFPWLRVAALVVILAGAGILAKQFIFKGDKKDIAQVKPAKKEEVKAAETTTNGTVSSNTDSVNPNPGSFTALSNQDKRPPANITKVNTPDNKATNSESGNGNVTTGEVTTMNNTPEPVTVAPVKTEDERNDQLKKTAAITEKKDIVREEVKENAGNNKQETGNAGTETRGLVTTQNDDQQKNRPAGLARKVAEDKNSRNQVNIFRGRVTDATNAGVPFANVSNVQDNYAGTYTDAKGYFNLTYPDTVLNVQVRSVGFENANVQLRNNVANNQVVLKDDKSLSEVVISNKKPNVAARSKEVNKTLEEPEPADGWDNYDTYLANNLVAPEEIKDKPNGAGEVQLSFEVDKNGEPVSIKIEKSLCEKCDLEAVRLIKEGPKWKRHAKKGRTTVTISFDHPL